MRGSEPDSRDPATGPTRIHVVSDVHGNTEALARAGDGADALICLGDLVLFLDYADHSRGIFPDLFGVENADRIGLGSPPPTKPKRSPPMSTA